MMTTTLTPPSTNGKVKPTVQLPASIVDPSGGDLAKPTADLLRELGVLETKEDMAEGVKITGTPQSLQVISAGGLSMTKLTGSLTGLAGTGSAAATFWSAFQAQELALRISLVAAAGVILAATAIAIALVVRGDINARSSATVAQYEARASIVRSLYNTVAPISLAQPKSTTADQAASAAVPNGAVPPACTDLSRALLTTVTAYPTAVRLKSTGAFVEVNGVRYCNEGLQVRLIDGDWVATDDVEQFRPV